MYSEIAMEIAKLPHEENEFSSEPFHQSDFKEFFDLVESCVIRLNFEMGGKAEWDSGILAGRFELQTHSVSVREHVDYVGAPSFFAAVVLKSDDRGLRRAYDPTAEFIGYGKSRKYSASLLPGTVFVFNPRKPHSLVYYGDAVTLALVGVSPSKGVRGWDYPVIEMF